MMPYFMQSGLVRPASPDDVPFVDRLQATISYAHADETPDPSLVPSEAEMPQAMCPACGLILTGSLDMDMTENTPIERLWCARCQRVVEVAWL